MSRNWHEEYLRVCEEKRVNNSGWHRLYNKQSRELKWTKRLNLGYFFLTMVFILLFNITPVCSQEHPNSLKPLLRAEALTRMVLQEANNEPIEGMVAVVGVALDRVEDPRWPDNPEAVVRQPYQFEGMSVTFRDYTEREITRARFAVEVAKGGGRPCGRVLWFHADHMMPEWARGDIVPACHIGNHIFYRDR